jgi:DNA primase
MGVTRLAILLDGSIIQTDGHSLKLIARRITEDTSWVQTAKLAIDNEYLISREVPNNLIEQFGLREVNRGIVFPLYNIDNKLIGAQIRNYNGRPRYSFVGTRTPLWPMSVLTTMKHNELLFVTEGVFGALRALKAGRKAVAVMGANSASDSLPYLENFRIVVAFDNDMPGLIGAAKILSVIPNAVAINPGVKADEMSVEEWQSFDGIVKTKRSILSIAMSSDNPALVNTSAQKFSLAWHKRTLQTRHKNYVH